MKPLLSSLAALFLLGSTATADPLKINSVAARHLKSNAVTTPKIADSAVTTAEIADTAVTAAKIADAAVTEAKLASSVGVFTKTAGKLTSGGLSFDGATTLVTLNGRVGIGTANPTFAPLEIAAGQNSLFFSHGLLTQTGASTSGSASYSISIFANNNIAANAVIAFSDARTKRIGGVSDGAADLHRLMGIEITDYTYLDTAGKGSAPQKKVIAQQVESVFPQAVQSGPGVIPDLYTKAAVRDGWIQLATDLKAGDRVRLIGKQGENIAEVAEVRDGAFRTTAAPPGDEVFVYGREVTDFRTVDYDAIAMLNVSATQELARRLEEKDTEITRLTKMVELLEARDREREERLVRLEHMMKSEPARPLQAAVQVP